VNPWVLLVKGRNPLGELVGNPGCQPGLATSFQLLNAIKLLPDTGERWFIELVAHCRLKINLRGLAH